MRVLSPGKFLLVNIPEEWESLIPQEITKNAERVNQRWVNLHHEFWGDTFKRTEDLLAFYSQEAKLVITTALHVASPCLAMGIPVVLIAEDPEENFQRFSSLSGILKIYTLKDLQEKKINFSPEIFDIEDLKESLLRNLELSIRQVWGEPISIAELRDVREYIARFSIQK